jgi:hypothetical protein
VIAALRAPRDAFAWAVEGLTTLPDAVRNLVPGAPVPAALREDALLAVARAHHASAMAWLHGEWRAFAGSVPDGDVRLALAEYAEACATAGRPVPPTGLTEVLPPPAVRGIRAVVARGRAEAGLEARTRRVVADVRSLRPSPRVVIDLPLSMVGLTVAAPIVLAGATLGALARKAPPIPLVEGADDPDVSLLGALAAEAIPVLLGNAAVRAMVMGSPLRVSLGIRTGGSAVTVRVGRGRAAVVDGIDPDATVVLQGDVEPLLRLAAGVVLREAHDLSFRPS